MNAAEFKEKYVGNEDEYYEVEGEGCALVEEGDDEVDHKTVFSSDIYSVGDQYFMVTNSRSNTGYWSDGESYEPTVDEVIPYVKTITSWKCI